jgi:hypothetical protein
LQNLPQRLPEVFGHFDFPDRPIRLGRPEAQFGRQPMAGPGSASARAGGLFNLLGRAATECGRPRRNNMLSRHGSPKTIERHPQFDRRPDRPPAKSSLNLVSIGRKFDIQKGTAARRSENGSIVLVRADAASLGRRGDQLRRASDMRPIRAEQVLDLSR